MSTIYKRNKGLTLIELIIVVVIIGILAAIAIPNFTLYQFRSKSTEAIANIGTIKISQYTFKSEHGAFSPCGLTLVAPISIKQPWTPALTNLGFTRIGFRPLGDVYYSYEVAVAGGSAIPNIANSALLGQSGTFCISALGDLDSDGINGEFGYSTDLTIITSTSQITGNCLKKNTIQNLQPGEY